ncbi:hypothetical protein [Paludisphaera mucosa]|uniref:Zinc-finger domain-containing protein n=1 Tax=Paludisphaera mucosa TaxID=3030827 RepID=A0ABT6FCJ0_9BACT|nr:hypothetical protein [Paludisphaera mucosa]MDG3005080.1 hypothetical protein [Paludisphaera mucosa]
MNCRDFDQIWNQLLDAESAARRDDPGIRLEREASLREHAEACPSCRLRHRQFEALRVAMRAWTARPRPAAEVSPLVAERILRAAAEPEILTARPRRQGRRVGLAAWALASAAMLALFVLKSDPPRDVRRPQVAAGAPAPRSLNVAVADARAASWRLARTASEPAARLGLAMLDASLAGDDAPAAEASPTSALDPWASPPALLDQVGGYAAAGARPLSAAARQAFGFLRSPTFDKPERAPGPPASSKGA